MARPGWDEFWLEIAKTASLRAECLRRKVGAVVIRDNKVMGLGFNGALPGAPSCLDGACPRGRQTYSDRPATSNYSDCISTHAEANALRNTRPEDRAGSIIYVNHAPCAGCQTLVKSVNACCLIWPEGKICYASDNEAP